MDLHRITLVILTALLMQYSNHMVRCVITDLHLVGGPVSNKGTVEIKQDGGDWETTCGENLDINDVIVICRQLGFTGASLAKTNTPYEQNSTPAIGLDCNGNEGNLSACPTLPTLSWCSSAGSASCHGDGFLGCFMDTSNGRVLSGENMLNISSMSISYCIQFCQESSTANYVYAGVENGNECYCGGKSDDYTRHGVAVDSNCHVSCSGDHTESCGGPGHIAVFRIHVQISETTSTIASTWSTEEIQDISTQKKPMTSQPSFEMTSGHSPRDDMSSPLTTAFFSTLQPKSHSSCLGVGLGEGVVIVILIVLLIALVIYIIRIRRMMKDSNKDQKTQHVDLVQPSSTYEKDTGLYHDIQDVMKPDPSTTSDGDIYYSSQIYEH